MLKVLAAPGPVSYPIIASSMKNRVDISFGKEGNLDVILDSTVSLVKRRLKINYGTIRGLMVVVPEIGSRIGVWRKGSAADVLTKALIFTKQLNASIIYVDDAEKIASMLNSGEIDSAVVSSAVGKGKTFEELLGIPGSCGAVINKGEDEFLRLYNEGIELIREDPEGTSEFIMSKLPIKQKKEFIIGTMVNSDLEIRKVDNYKEFEELVKRFL
ncbi:DUF3834 domain-containing protein [Acidianus sp. RZ1]|uniref:DUF3834 domain-containing protein n=1 Tax=Acidianus sp. RZ1 TaxID=1540082 RepID=UPI001491ED6F|nr:DUF3834 domain-containing protein [Acidianus sp. RZ1]NON61648.1 DUF3834 domain-containing protein [Acidianus sp. RZ1]